MENNYFALLANDVKKLWNGLDEGQKLGMLGLIVVTIVAATFFLSKAMEPDWVVLYSDLNEVNALTIVENMKKNGYQYKVSEDKKSILVPSNVRDDMRIFVAENDLIKTGDGGFELLDDMQLGSTDFKNKLTKQRIFQGELTRSIEKISGVKKARVQLAEPERSIFSDNDEEPSASVVLILEPGVKLKASQILAIKNLVSYAVPRLTTDRVFLADQYGNALSEDVSKNYPNLRLEADYYMFYEHCAYYRLLHKSSERIKENSDPISLLYLKRVLSNPYLDRKSKIAFVLLKFHVYRILQKIRRG